MLDTNRFSRDTLAGLPADLRSECLVEMGAVASLELSGATTLADFQERLHRLIDYDLVGRLGHWLSRSEYDCEVEYWGGKSYMDQSLPNELLLRSEYPLGVQFNWGEFTFLL